MIDSIHINTTMFPGWSNTEVCLYTDDKRIVTLSGLSESELETVQKAQRALRRQPDNVTSPTVEVWDCETRTRDIRSLK